MMPWALHFSDANTGIIANIEPDKQQAFNKGLSLFWMESL